MSERTDGTAKRIARVGLVACAAAIVLLLAAAAMPRTALAQQTQPFATAQSQITDQSIVQATYDGALLPQAAPAYDISWYSSSATSYTLSNDSNGTVANKLLGLAKIVNGDLLIQDSFEGKTIAIDSSVINVDFNSAGQWDWTPIGTSAHPFAGTFNGSSKEISGFTISSTYQNAGLFGVTSTAATLKNVSVSAGSSTVPGKITLGTTAAPYTAGEIMCVGTLVGDSQGAIQNCKSSMDIGIVNNTAVTAASMPVIVDGVGGLVGRCRGNLADSSYSGTVDIYSASSTDNGGDQGYLIMNCIGGVAGFFGTIENPDATTATITGCTNSGTVKVNTGGYASGDRFGEAVVSQAGYVGGVAGFTTGSISKSSNSGSVDTSYRMATAIYGTTIGAAGSYIGGVAGGLRSDIFPSMEAAMRAAGTYIEGEFDAGTGGASNPVTVSECYDTGSVFGNHGVGGVVGEAGWYSNIVSCYCDIPVGTADPTDEDYLIKVGGVKAARWNKPMGGGIVGKTYGDTSYCYNRSRVWSTTDAGYYIAGIAGVIFKGTSVTGYEAPTPEMWACYNTGYCQSGLRAASLAGQNEGYIHDCYALPETSYHGAGENKYAEQLVFSQYATITRSDFLEVSALKSSAGVAKLNYMAASEGWGNSFVTAASDSDNDGYPILSWQDTSTTKTNLADDSAEVEITLDRDADFNGTEAIPTLKVTYNDTELVQNADFKVIPQTGAINKTLDVDRTTGTRPYKATIQGIGRYSGTPALTADYGIVVGDLSSCTFAIDEHVYTGQPVQLAASQLKLIGVTGNVVPSDSYTYVVNSGNDCVKRGSYKVVATAKSGGDGNYVGSLSDTAFVISPADLYEDCAVSGVSCNGTSYTSSQLGAMSFTYTGSPIKPTVTGVTYNGLALAAGSSATDVNGDYYVSYLTDGNYTDVSAKNNIDVQATNPTTIGNYHNYVDMYFAITAADINSATITVPDQAYTGSERGLAKLTFNGKTLVEGTDYTVTYANNVAKGSTATATITGTGNFTGTATKTFKILDQAPVDISSATISSIADQEWTGQEVTPKPTVICGGKTLVEGTDYVLTYANNTGASASSATAGATVQATVTATGCGAYAGAVSQNFNIVSHKVTLKVGFGKFVTQAASGNSTSYSTVSFDGSDTFRITSADKSFVKGLGSTATIEVIRSTSVHPEYNLTGITVTGATSGTSYPVTLVSAKNTLDTSGTNDIVCTFTVPDEDVVIAANALNYTTATKSIADCTIDSIAGQTYTGSAVKPVPVVKDSSGNTLTEGTDYQVFRYQNNVDVGADTASVEIVGMGDYSGNKTANFTIIPKEGMIVSADNVVATYDGNGYGVVATANMPSASIKYGVVGDDSTISYTLSKSPTFTESGVHTVYFQATAPGYLATGTATVTINKRAATVKANDVSKEVLGSDPVLTVAMTNVLPGDMSGIAYSISRTAGESVGTYPITVTGTADQGNYTLTFQGGTFTILEHGALSVSASNVSATYDKQAHGIADARASVAGATITYGTQEGACTLSASPTFTDAGTYTVYMQAAKSGYTTATGSATVTIAQAPVTITADAASKTYGAANPTALTAVVKGAVGGDTIGYAVALVGVDTGSAAGTYKGALRPSLTASQPNYAITLVNGDFTVNPEDMAGATVADIASKAYTGSAIEPTVKVTMGTTTLVKGTDYTVAYSNNTAPGTATVTITGKGNYAGTKTATFTITAPPAADRIVRLYGDGALDTMKAVVDAGSFAKGGTVVVATDGGYYDALTASALAGVSDGCVLLTNGGRLSSQTAAELKALAPSKVVVVGGPGAVSETVRGQIAAAAGLASSKVSRVYGYSATDTADAIWEEAKAEGLASDTCIIATSDDFKDALSVAPAAYAKGYPIFLAGSGATLSAHTLSTIKAAGFTKAVVIGGTGALPTAKIDDVLKAKTGITSVSRYWGKSCFQTSSAVANWEISDLGMSANNLAVATADSYPDALCGAALCGKNNAILVLAVPSDTSCIAGVVHANRASVARAYLFGGAGVLPDDTIKAPLITALS